MEIAWIRTRPAADLGVTLADALAPPKAGQSGSRAKSNIGDLPALLSRSREQLAALRLNFFTKAKLANSFKWRLLENGLDEDLAAKLTHSLVLQLSGQIRAPEAGPNDKEDPRRAPVARRKSDEAMQRAERHIRDGQFQAAAACYQEVIEVAPQRKDAFNNLGAALCKTGRYSESLPYFRQAIALDGDYADAHANLGSALRTLGQLQASEQSLRRALKLSSTHVDALVSLGLTELASGRLEEAKVRFEHALRLAPASEPARVGAAQTAINMGDFDAARTYIEKVLSKDALSAAALSLVPATRRMQLADTAWLHNAEASILRGGGPFDEATIRFAIGKYFDDIGEYDRAFDNYKRANEILKSIAAPYEPAAHEQLVDKIIRSYGKADRSTDSESSESGIVPVLVVGMMRSGTSLIEQILASHPSVSGAGELSYWADVAQQRSELFDQPMDPARAQELASGYLKLLSRHANGAQFVVDKAPINTHYLGLVSSALPRAKLVYVQRDARDTCLSCYFQQFALSLNFTFDLNDLAHFYRQHKRVYQHWKSVLPQDHLFEIPYAGLVEDQEYWSRRLLEFLGLPWDDRCLTFHKTRRSVATASSWQVRQPMYKTSIERWRNYRRHIKPLLGLRP